MQNLTELHLAVLDADQILNEMQEVLAVLAPVLLVSAIFSLLYLLWYLWAMARLFPRIGLRAGEGWVPILNQWRLLQRAGLPGWVILLSFIGLGIVPLVFLIIAMHRINTQAGVGAGYTVLGALIPPLWATLLANRIGHRVVSDPATTYGVSHGSGYGAQAYGEQSFNGQSYGGYPASGQNQQQNPYAAPAGPPASSTAQQDALWAPQQPPAAPSTDAGPWSLGLTTEREFERLASQGPMAPPAAPLTPAAPAKPFDWAGIAEQGRNAAPVVPPPMHPAAVSAPPAPAPPVVPADPAPPVTEPPAPPASAVAPPLLPVPPPPALPATSVPPAPPGAPAGPVLLPPQPAVAPPAPPAAPAAAAPEDIDDRTVVTSPPTAEPDEDLDQTVAVVRPSKTIWVLELPGGETLALEPDVVIGRRPTPRDGSAVLAIADPTRTLSKSHVHMRLQGETWLVEDLGSTNGLTIVRDGVDQEVPMGITVEATEEMLFGTLEVRLRRSGSAE